MTICLYFIISADAFKVFSHARKFPDDEKPTGFSALKALLDVVCLNSRVKLESKEGKVAPSGDATELGLYRFCETAVHKAVMNAFVEDYREHHPKLFEIPFNSANKWQLSIHNMGNMNLVGEDRVSSACTEMIMFKGAPDVLLSKCSRYINSAGDIVAINDEFSALYNAVYEDFGGEVVQCVYLFTVYLLILSVTGRASAGLCNASPDNQRAAGACRKPRLL